MAKQIITLSVDGLSTNGIVSIRYLLWLTTPTPAPKPQATSQYPAASTNELLALQAGTIIEEGYAQTFPASLSTAEIKIFLQAHFASRQAALAAVTQPGAYFGVFFDSGTGWSA